MVERVKLISMTAVLTVLIWAGADSLVNEVVSVQVSFEVLPLSNPDMLIEIDPAAKSQFFEVQLAGPRRIAEKIQTLEDSLILRLKVDDRPSGPSVVSLDKEMLKRLMADQWREIRKLAILSIQPGSLPVLVDHMITRDVNLVARRLSLAYENEPQLRRSVASIRMRESRFNELISGGDQPQIEIGPDIERLLRGKPPGLRASVRVSINTSQFGSDATVAPDTVEVVATVKADRQTADIPTVPIKPAVSFTNLERALRAVARDGTPLSLVTQTIKVIGPTEDVAALLRGDTRAYGFIQFKEADLADLDVFKAWTPEFLLPPNIELAEPADTIECKLTNASATGNGD